MRFLLLTRAGFDDLAARADLSEASLHIPPDLLSSDEINLLRQAGADVYILPVSVDPDAARSLLDAAQSVQPDGSGPVWVECAPASSIAAGLTPPAAPALAATDPTDEALHHRLAKTAGTLAGQALRRLGKNFSPTGRLIIIPYLGYGNLQRLSVRGRLLEDEGFREQSPDDSRWSNFVHLYKRLESDEVAGARIRARFGKVIQEAVTDQGGYFSFEIVPVPPLTDSGWHTVDLELLDPPAGARRSGPRHGGSPGAALHRAFWCHQRHRRHGPVDECHQQAEYAEDAGALERAYPQAVQGRGRLLPGAAGWCCRE